MAQARLMPSWRAARRPALLLEGLDGLPLVELNVAGNHLTELGGLKGELGDWWM